MKLVGGDSGRCEQEEFVEEVLLAPSERAVVDVLFDEPGRATLEHHHPDRCYPLAAITVSGDRIVPSLGQQYEVLRNNPELAEERERITPYLAAAQWTGVGRQCVWGNGEIALAEAAGQLSR